VLAGVAAPGQVSIATRACQCVDDAAARELVAVAAALRWPHQPLPVGGHDQLTDFGHAARSGAVPLSAADVVLFVERRIWTPDDRPLQPSSFDLPFIKEHTMFRLRRHQLPAQLIVAELAHQPARRQRSSARCLSGPRSRDLLYTRSINIRLCSPGLFNSCKILPTNMFRGTTGSRLDQRAVLLVAHTVT
jgi:hypothetical protein